MYPRRTLLGAGFYIAIFNFFRSLPCLPPYTLSPYSPIRSFQSHYLWFSAKMTSAFSRLFLLAASVTSVTASCGSLTHLFPRAEGEEVPISTFGYTGTTGPVLWTQLDPAANGLCSTGSNQSPINMVEGQFTLIPASDIELTIPDVTEGTTFENLGSTVEVVMKDLGGTFVLEGKTYTLEQFHCKCFVLAAQMFELYDSLLTWLFVVHHPSEHLDNDVSLPSKQTLSL